MGCRPAGAHVIIPTCTLPPPPPPRKSTEVSSTHRRPVLNHALAVCANHGIRRLVVPHGRHWRGVQAGQAVQRLVAAAARTGRSARGGRVNIGGTASSVGPLRSWRGSTQRLQQCRHSRGSGGRRKASHLRMSYMWIAPLPLSLTASFALASPRLQGRRRRRLLCAGRCKGRSAGLAFWAADACCTCHDVQGPAYSHAATCMGCWLAGAHLKHHSTQPGTQGRRSMAIMSKDATSNTCKQQHTACV